jgi:predicted nucleic acid-binding protein
MCGEFGEVALMIFDTDVMIWALRGRSKAADAIDNASDRAITAVTYMELLQGARDRNEVIAIKRFLQDVGIALYPLSEEIGHRAAIYMEQYTLKTGLSMPDSLVAATAAESGETLCTANRKHYRAIHDLSIKVFHP